MELSFKKIWETWTKYRRGKKKSSELSVFEFKLVENILKLTELLRRNIYRHGGYRKFEVCDNKRRIISVAPLRDRIVHRLIYEELKIIFDKTFDFDVWSCRESKGLVGCVRRTSKLLKKFQGYYFWRADIKKFFESVDKNILIQIIERKRIDKNLLILIVEIINSYSPGMSIGNLTSQIFANIYLNEFDRFVRRELKPRGYIRYGDDFILLGKEDFLREARGKAILFLEHALALQINGKNDFIGKASQGAKFLGCRIYPDTIILNRRNQKRIFQKLNAKNISSYYGLIKQFGNNDLKRRLAWEFIQIMTNPWS